MSARADPGPDATADPERRRVPRIIWWITALHVTVLVAYSILLPTYRAPDEPLHVDLAHLFAEELEYPAWDDRDTGAGVERSLAFMQFADRSAHLSAEEAVPKDERPSLEDLEDPAQPRGINQLPQHPPLYYVVAGGAERLTEVVTGDLDFQLETWFYRLVSIGFVAPLPLIIWRVSTVLRLPTVVGVAAALVPLAIPQHLHIGSSVNNDSLQVLLFWLSTPIVLRLAGGHLRPRTASLAGLVTGLCLLTKGFAVVLILWALGSLLLALVRMGRGGVVRVAQAGAVYVSVSFAVGGWWWARNILLYGRVMPSRYSQAFPPRENRVADLGTFLDAWSSATIRRFWGEFGWFDVHISVVVIQVATALCLLALIVACVSRDRVGTTSRADRLLLAVPFLLLVVVQFGGALNAYLDTGRLPALQGRYWFGSLAALAVLVALGLANILRRGLRWLPFGILVAAGLIQGFAVSTILGYYWGEPGSGLADRVRAIVAWAPLPGDVIALGAIIAAVVGLVAFGQIGRYALRPSHVGDPGAHTSRLTTGPQTSSA